MGLSIGITATQRRGGNPQGISTTERPTGEEGEDMPNFNLSANAASSGKLARVYPKGSKSANNGDFGERKSFSA